MEECSGKLVKEVKTTPEFLEKFKVNQAKRRTKTLHMKDLACTKDPGKNEVVVYVQVL